MRVAALGRTHWLYDAIGAVAAAGHDITFIATAPEQPEYRRGAADFATLAARLGCPFHAEPAASSALVDGLRQSSAEIAISVNWPRLLTPEVLTLPSHGVLNAHCGDLPRYRGNAAPNWAIIAGERHIGLTIHRMDESLDAGPVLLKKYMPIDETAYIGDVYAMLDELVPALFVEAVNGLAAGALSFTPQPTRGAMRCLPRRPEDSRIDWRQPALQIARLVRASAEPFAGAFTEMDGSRLTIWRAHAVEPTCAYLGAPGQIVQRCTATGTVDVLTGEGLLRVEVVELGGGRRKAAEVIGTGCRL